MRIKRTFSSLITSDEEEPLLNLTPLIDVVFVVLILFILVAPMLEVDKVDLAPSVALESRKSASAPETNPINIHVREDNTIWIKGSKVSVETLLSILKQEKIDHPDQVPQLFHDKKAQFGIYQNIKNAVELAGFEQLDVILQPSSL